MKRYAIVRNDHLHHDRLRAPFAANLLDELQGFFDNLSDAEALTWGDGDHRYVYPLMGAIVEAPLADPGTSSNDDIPDDEWVVAENMWRGEP